MRTKRNVLNARLPATPCTPEMQQAVVDIAIDQGASVAEIMRQAVTLFLRKSDTDTIKIDSSQPTSRQVVHA